MSEPHVPDPSTSPEEPLYPPGDDPAECGCERVHEDVKAYELTSPDGQHMLQFVINRDEEVECIHYFPADGAPRVVTVAEAEEIVASAK